MHFLNEVPDWIIVVAAVITACGVIWRKFVMPVMHMLHRIESSLKYVEEEMHFNGGATQRDAIARIDKAVQHLDARLKRIEQNTGGTDQ